VSWNSVRLPHLLAVDYDLCDHCVLVDLVLSTHTVFVNCVPFVAWPYSHNDPDDTVVFVSGHRLRRSYEFCRMYDEPIHWRDVHPCGQFLVVMVPQVSELLEGFCVVH
jgi:hypothetical protein